MAGETPTKQLGIRVPESILRRLDLYAEELTRQMPGMAFTRADAARVLLEKALTDVGLPAEEPKGAKRSKDR